MKAACHRNICFIIVLLGHNVPQKALECCGMLMDRCVPDLAESHSLVYRRYTCCVRVCRTVLCILQRVRFYKLIVHAIYDNLYRFELGLYKLTFPLYYLRMQYPNNTNERVNQSAKNRRNAKKRSSVLVVIWRARMMC